MKRFNGGEIGRWGWTAVLALTAGCAGVAVSPGPEVSTAAFQVIEEPGLWAVRNLRPESAPGSWSLSPEPTLVIGGAGGSAPYLFASITHAQTLPDARILVLSSGEGPSVRLFAPDGSHLLSTGESGNREGEFRLTSGHRVSPTELVVVDRYNGRCTQVMEDGSFGDTWFCNATSSELGLELPEGRVLWVENPAMASAFDRSGAPGHLQLAASIRVGSRIDRESESIAEIRSHAFEVVDVGEGRWAFWVPISPMDVYAYDWTSNRLVVTSDESDLTILPLDGGTPIRVQAEIEIRPVTPEEWNRALEAEANSERARARAERCADCEIARRMAYERMDIPRYHATYGRIVIGDAGELWVARHLPEEEAARADLLEWEIFDRDGRWLTTMALPRELHPFEIGEGHILGRWTDELGVQSVRRFRLLRR